MRYAISLFFAAALTAPAQTVSFGAKAGAPLTAAPTAGLVLFGPGLFGSHEDTGRWTVGPTFELHLKCNFSFVVDALYREYRSGSSTLFRFGSDLAPVASSIQTDANVWDIPFLLRYRFLDGDTRPFVNIGISVTHESTESLSTAACLGPVESCYPPDWPSPPPSGIQFNFSESSRTRGGVVVGAGVEFRKGKIKIAPELRYTRLTEPVGNQVALLVGFTF